MRVVCCVVCCIVRCKTWNICYVTRFYIAISNINIVDNNRLLTIVLVLVAFSLIVSNLLDYISRLVFCYLFFTLRLGGFKKLTLFLKIFLLDIICIIKTHLLFVCSRIICQIEFSFLIKFISINIRCAKIIISLFFTIITLFFLTIVYFWIIPSNKWRVLQFLVMCFLTSFFVLTKWLLIIIDFIRLLLLMRALYHFH